MNTVLSPPFSTAVTCNHAVIFLHFFSSILLTILLFGRYLVVSELPAFHWDLYSHLSGVQKL